MNLIDDSYGYKFEPELISALSKEGKHKKVSQGDTLMDYDQPIKFMPLILRGAIKVLRQDENEEELLLYFLESGDACAMTMNCCIGNKRSEIRAVAETETELILIPIDKMMNWIEKYPTWRSFVFESYHQRFNELLEAIDNLAFKNMHERLLLYLKDKAIINKSEYLAITHQEIAMELHTSRVVISRLLSSLEKEGYISRSRNQIKVKLI